MYRDYYFTSEFSLEKRLVEFDLKGVFPLGFLERTSQAYLRQVTVRGNVMRLSLNGSLSSEEIKESSLQMLRLKRIDVFQAMKKLSLNCYLKHPF